MSAVAEATQQEIGRRLKQVRDAAKLNQVELARRVTWSPAVLSRVESGERVLTTDELKLVLEAIGTSDALQLATVITREWRELPRPPLDHPDQDALWVAEQVCRELVALRNHPDVRHAFERRLTEYIEAIRQGAALLLKRDHEIAFIGSKGIGKSTAICKATGLEVASPDGSAPMPVLESGGGGVTVCDVHLSSGQGYGILVEPCSDDDIRAHVTDFAEHIKGAGAGKTEGEGGEDDAHGIAQEIERAVRNLADFKVHRPKTADGKVVRRDEAKELAGSTASVRAYVVEVLARMNLHRRDRRDIWYDQSSGKAPLAWLQDTFEQINNGRHPEFTLPTRIDIIVPQTLLPGTDLSVRLIDTRGIDRTAMRADVERRLDEPHTLALLCSSFNDAPSTASHLLLERAKQAGVRRLETNTVLLVLPRANEALAVKDESGTRATTTEDGYELKAEFAAMALEPLGLRNLKIGFFNSFGDDPARLRQLIVERLLTARQSFRSRLAEDVASARTLLANFQKEQVNEVLRAAARMLATWVAQNKSVPALSGHVQDSLLSEIRKTYASTVRATIRREGAWANLSYKHHLGFGARKLAVSALQPVVEKFVAATELLSANPEYAEAKNLIQQARRVFEAAYDELLRKAQIMGETVFMEALKFDPSLWAQCDAEWGKGFGYRDKVAGWNQQWFTAQPRQDLERELSQVISHEWDAALKRVLSLFETDAAAAA